jgi:hypothetical protein
MLKIRGPGVGPTQLNFGVSADGGYGWIQTTDIAVSNERNIILGPLGGNVGIGTTSPNTLLNVHGANPFVRINNTSADDHGIKISYNNSETHGLNLIYNANSAVSSIDNTYPVSAAQVYGDIRFRQNVAGTMTTRMTIKGDGGNVGIGTTNPYSLLDVQLASAATRYLTLSTNDGQGSFNGFGLNFRIADQAHDIAQIRGDYENSNGGGYGGLFIATRFSGTLYNRLSINDNGRVGIGVSYGTTLLSVGGAGSISAASGITFGADASANLYRIEAGTVRTDGALVAGTYIRSSNYIQLLNDLYPGSYTDYLKLNVGNSAGNAWDTYPVVIKKGTYVGIGTNAPSGKLHIVSSVAGETVLRADGTNGTLFSIVDDLSDSLMSVNNSAGLPVLEVFADDRVVAGQYGSGDFVLINNKVGLGTSNPANKLTVIGGASIGSSTYNTSAPSNGLIVEGNVGIGTTNPSYKLDVNASVTDAGRFYNNQIACQLSLGSTANTEYVNLIWYTSNGNAQFFKNRSSASWGGTDSMNLYNNNGGFGFHANGVANSVIITTAGNVGIGSSNPSEKLIVNGNIGFAGDLNRYLFMPDIYQGTGSICIQAGFGSAAAGGAIKLHGHLATTYIGGDVEVGMSEKGDFLINTAIGGTRRVTVKNDGNVGIGTITPSGKLHINTASYSSLFRPLVVNNGVQAVNARLYDTAVIQQDDVTTLRLVERNSAVANQILSFSIGDGFARIACTAQPMQFYVNGGDGIGDYGYIGLNGTKAIEISTTANVGIGNVTPSAARLHIKGDGFNPVLRVETALLAGAAGGTASKTFVGWMPMQTGALSPGDTVFIPLFK